MSSVPCPGCGRAIDVPLDLLSSLIECAKCGVRFHVPPGRPATVRVSARILNWPDRCACCLGPADAEFDACSTRRTGVRVVRTTTKGWAVPYCSGCLDHVDADEEAVRLEAEARAARSRATSTLTVGIVVGVAVVLLDCCGLAGAVLSASAPPAATGGHKQAREEAAGPPPIAAVGLCCVPLSLAVGAAFVVACFMTRSASERAASAAAAARSQADGLLRPTCATPLPAVRYGGWHGSVHTFEFSNGHFGRAFREANSGKVL